MRTPFDPADTRVLVVDDDESVRESLARFLADRDLQVEAASSAAQAQALALARDFHFAIVDIRLPDVSGDVLIPRLHALRPGIRFLIYTGSTSFKLSAELIEIGLEAGAVFHKPTDDMSVLMSAMQRLWEA